MSYNSETNMYEGYIYLVTNIVNNKKYIGQTIQDVKTRLQKHCNTKQKYAFQCAIQKYGIENFNICTLETISNPDKKELKKILNDKEQYWIEYYNTTNNNFGYNLTKGGERYSISLGKNVYKFNLHTGELLKKYDTLTEASYDVVGSGNYYCILQCARHDIKQAYGYMWEFTPVCDRIYSSKYSRPSGYKKIKQYDLNGNYIKEWDSIISAANYYNIDRSQISSCCNGHISYYNNYVWRFIDDDFNTYVFKTRGKYIANYDSKLNLVNIFSNAPSAANYFGVSDSCIKSSLRNPQKKSCGFYWRYYNEDNIDLKEIIYKTPDNFMKGVLAS